MPERIFHNHPPSKINELYLCTKCGGQFPLDELIRCPVCGYYYCESCITHHQCISMPDGSVILQFDGSIERVDKTKPVVDKKTRAFCCICGEPHILSELKRCPVCGKYYCEKHQNYLTTCDTCGAVVCRSCLKEHKYEENLRTCDGCGKKYPKEEMKRCRTCGQIFCPTCRKKHKH